MIWHLSVLSSYLLDHIFPRAMTNLSVGNGSKFYRCYKSMTMFFSRSTYCHIKQRFLSYNHHIAGQEN